MLRVLANYPKRPIEEAFAVRRSLTNSVSGEVTIFVKGEPEIGLARLSLSRATQPNLFERREADLLT